MSIREAHFTLKEGLKTVANKYREAHQYNLRNAVKAMRKRAMDQQINNIGTLVRDGVLSAEDVFFLMPRCNETVQIRTTRTNNR